MKETVKKLSKEQIEFICEECSITEAELFAMNDDEMYDRVYDVMCDIEIDETPSNDEPLSEHCKMAADLVTELGNALAQAQGLYDEEAE